MPPTDPAGMKFDKTLNKLGVFPPTIGRCGTCTRRPWDHTCDQAAEAILPLIDVELIKVRLIELELLEQALHQGLNISAYTRQRLADLTEQLDKLEASGEQPS